MVRVSRDVHLVDHSRDQEHPPASRRLRTAQLCLQIWHNPGLGRRRSTAPIGYAHHEVLILDEDHNLYGHLRSVVVAVFHGVHGRFGHRCLESLYTLLRRTQLLYHPCYLLHRRAFVPWLVRKGKVGEDPPIAVVARRIRPQSALAIGHCSLRSLQGERDDVVLLHPVFAREVGQLGQQRIDGLLAATRATTHDQLPYVLGAAADLCRRNVTQPTWTTSSTEVLSDACSINHCSAMRRWVLRELRSTNEDPTPLDQGGYPQAVQIVTLPQLLLEPQ